MKDLAASITKLGVQQPGVVRKMNALRGLAVYEIVCGERRWRASRLAGVAHFPAIVRELDDAEVLEIQLVENIQREDTHPLEEAAGYQELMKVGKLTAEQVADRVGLSRSQVYSRLNLLKLEGGARTALEAGQLDASRALVVASVAQPNQRAKALELATQRDDKNEFVHSVRDLRRLLLQDELVIQLRAAPFAMDDATLLPDMGACTGCQFRSGNHDPETTDPDVCTNQACYQLKVKASGKRREQQAHAQGRTVLRGAEARALFHGKHDLVGHVDLDAKCDWDDYPQKYPSTKTKGETPEQLVVRQNEWERKNEEWLPRTYRELLRDKKYEVVLAEDPRVKRIRELVPVKLARELLKKDGIAIPQWAAKKPEPRPTYTPSPEPKPETPAQKEKREAKAKELERQAKIEEAYLEALGNEIRRKGGAAFDREDLVAIATLIGNDYEAEDGLDAVGYKKTPAFAKLSEQELRAFIRLALIARDNFDAEAMLEPTQGLAKRLKVDWKKVRKAVEAKFPVAKKGEKK
jgi:ParB/RepB/Spo0J family partition protein